MRTADINAAIAEGHTAFAANLGITRGHRDDITASSVVRVEVLDTGVDRRTQQAFFVERKQWFRKNSDQWGARWRETAYRGGVRIRYTPEDTVRAQPGDRAIMMARDVDEVESFVRPADILGTWSDRLAAIEEKQQREQRQQEQRQMRIDAAAEFLTEHDIGHPDEATLDRLGEGLLGRDHPFETVSVIQPDVYVVDGYTYLHQRPQTDDLILPVDRREYKTSPGAYARQLLLRAYIESRSA